VDGPLLKETSRSSSLVECRRYCRSSMSASSDFVEAECPVCYMDLFNESGICEKAEGVAATVCHHVVHVACLKSFQCCSVNGSGRGRGDDNGASSSPEQESSSFCLFGEERDLHCPVCSRSVSIYTSSSEAAYFPGFWIPLIQSCIERFLAEKVSSSSSAEGTIGTTTRPSNRSSSRSDGDSSTRIPAESIRKELLKNDSLTESQKKYIFDAPCSKNAGLQQALTWAGKVPRASSTLLPSSSSAATSPTSSAITLPGLNTRGLWQYDAQSDEICVYKTVLGEDLEDVW
jgi:hypothetical protein